MSSPPMHRHALNEYDGDDRFTMTATALQNECEAVTRAWVKHDAAANHVGVQAIVHYEERWPGIHEHEIAREAGMRVTRVAVVSPGVIDLFLRPPQEGTADA